MNGNVNNSARARIRGRREEIIKKESLMKDQRITFGKKKYIENKNGGSCRYLTRGGK
jgi:hypothetical protein